jgi:hypothetical protein
MAQYVVSRAAYLYPVTSARYLVGLYLCAPLVAALLVSGLRAGWGWGANGSPSIRTARLPPVSAVGAIALLVIVIALTVGGWQRAFAEASDRATFGQPTGQRQAVLIAYLREQRITRFYTDYWTCYQLVFATDQRLACAVFDDEHVFGRGTARLDAMSDLVAATSHARASELAAAIAQRDPHVEGYTVTHVGTYDVYVCPRAA